MAYPPNGRASSDNDNSVFLDNEVLQQIYQVITDATVTITLVTPYLGLWEHLKTKIDEAINRKVGISFILRDFANEKFAKTHPAEDIGWLKSRDIQVIEVPNLHSKIYLNERTVLISSMNITEPSIANSRDFAMIVKSAEDANRFRAYVSILIEKFGRTRPANSIGQRAWNSTSGLIRGIGSMQSPLSAGKQTGKVGTCIRCGDKMGFNKERPLCDDCYQKWAKFKNEDFREKRCHSCGKIAETTYARPLCITCWRRTVT
jgi:hypothetical protein